VDGLTQAQSSLERLYLSLRNTSIGTADLESDFVKEFNRAMDDDFNTPEALAALFECAKEMNRCRTADPARLADLAATLKHLGGILGVLQRDPETYLQGQTVAETFEAVEIEALIAQRIQAKKDRDFTQADKIRELLKIKGVIIEDTATGTQWRRG
jgi:cysteinyl-tRNA synthetase